MVASEVSAEVRQEGGDSGASTPAPISPTFHNIKSRALTIPSHIRSKPSRRQASNPPKAQDGFLRPCSQHSAELSLTLKLSWRHSHVFTFTYVYSEACVCTHSHVFTPTLSAHCAQSQGPGPNTTWRNDQALAVREQAIRTSSGWREKGDFHQSELDGRWPWGLEMGWAHYCFRFCKQLLQMNTVRAPTSGS